MCCPRARPARPGRVRLVASAHEDPGRSARPRRCGPRRRAGSAACRRRGRAELPRRRDRHRRPPEGALRRQTLVELDRLLAIVRKPAWASSPPARTRAMAMPSDFRLRRNRSFSVRDSRSNRAERSTLERRTREALWGLPPMSVTDRTPLLQSLQLQEELRTTVDERTLQILDRRRRTASSSGAAGSCGGCSSLPMSSVSSERPPAGPMAGAGERQRRRLLAATGDLRVPAHRSGVDRDHEALRPL